MNKTLLFSGILFTQIAFGQVSVKKNKLVKDGQTYKMSQYENVFSNAEALETFKKSRTNNTVGSIFAYTGGFGIGLGLGGILFSPKEYQHSLSGNMIKNDKSGYWAIVGIGAGLVGIGIPFAIASKKNMDKALQIENGESTAFQPYFKLESAGNGLALSYNF